MRTRGRRSVPANAECLARAGQPETTLDDLISGIDDGVLIEGRGSYSIDQQRYNFQFGGDAFWEIKGGKKQGMLSRVSYQARTPDFWQACDGIAGPATGNSSEPAATPKASPRRSMPSAMDARRRASARSTSSSRINQMLTREQAQKLAETVIAFSTFPECSVSVTSSEQAFNRFANNGITTAALVNRHQVSISATREGRTGNTVVSDLEDSALRAAVKRAEEMAAIAPPNPEHARPSASRSTRRRTTTTSVRRGHGRPR